MTLSFNLFLFLFSNFSFSFSFLLSFVYSLLCLFLLLLFLSFVHLSVCSSANFCLSVCLSACLSLFLSLSPPSLPPFHYFLTKIIFFLFLPFFAFFSRAAPVSEQLRPEQTHPAELGIPGGTGHPRAGRGSRLRCGRQCQHLR